MAELRTCSCCGKDKPYVMVGGKTYCLDCAKDLHAKKHGGGFLGAIAFVGFVVLVLMFFFGGSTSDDKSLPPRAKVTSAPQVTSTPSWDVPVTWARYAAQQNMPKDMALDTVEISTSGGERYLTIACNMDTMWDGDDYIEASADLICGVIPVIRDKNNFEHVTFLFYGPFIDKYGNSVQSLGIRAMYSRDTLQKVNVDYFGLYTHSNPTGVIKAADEYMIHPLYTK